ncbi:hypothetical protein F8388_011986 [Cannabis sativa]|uniref:KIB1-4 beta-propeller domain-containing protein n=1 Tax=Cannabis sativa TaxID=3483 RepID=A0A7J6GDQ4_CANSA|nr:hypothetical protein F8388_011986 [Cannabis sativa]
MKTKKKAAPPNKNNHNMENCRSSWPNLPQRLIKHLEKHSSLMPTINFGSVTKSWRSHTNKRHYCNTNHKHHQQTQSYNWLSESNDHNYNQNQVKKPQLCQISFPFDHVNTNWYFRKRELKPIPWLNFWGCCYGHLVVQRVDMMSQITIFDPIDQQCSYGWSVDNLGDNNIPIKGVALWSSPNSCYNSKKSCVMMVVTGISSPAFMFYWLRGKPDSHDWIKQDCPLVDPHEEYFQSKKSDRNQPFMRFTNAIGVNGKFYALSSQGTLVVIEHVVDIFEITGVGKARAIPSVLCKGFRECLIEYDGEILLVFLVFGEQDRVVDGVEVYKLCLDDLSLIKMKSLDEKTLFVGSDCCVLVGADKVGCRGNCVYFREQREGDMDGWFEYDMKVGEISLVWSHSTTKCVEWDEPIAEDDDPDLKRNREIIGYPHKGGSNIPRLICQVYHKLGHTTAVCRYRFDKGFFTLKAGET